MNYQFLSSSIEKENLVLPNSDKINPFLLKNNQDEIFKAIDFIASEEKFLYIHGFLGTGKRQFINYLSEFIANDVIKLEYYCKNATVCDDILLYFNDILEKLPLAKAVNFNTKIATLNVKFTKQISSIRKPFLIILHSFDDILEENQELVKNCFANILQEDNVKIIISTRALIPSVLDESIERKKIFLKALKKSIFKQYLNSNDITITSTTLDDFYKYTRGYYYYTALCIKIIQAMKININEFLDKFNKSGMSFDDFLEATYVNLVPTTIRNFFWFLKSIRHGISLNALAVIEIYDEFSIEYLKTNLMIFQVNETLYVQDYFLQKPDLSIPKKTEIKLHKYIISIYEKLLKEPIKTRSICLSRQAMRTEIEYHSKKINMIENSESVDEDSQPIQVKQEQTDNSDNQEIQVLTINDKIKIAQNLASEKKYTDAISSLKNILETEEVDLSTLVEIRLLLAKLYKSIESYNYSCHYYELVETYYKTHKENINLCYLYYEMTDLYYKMYKLERAIETVKNVIYSVDTPQSLMVEACTLLGNIYSDMNDKSEAYVYYKKALESLDDNDEESVIAEVYFKYALINDDNENEDLALDYYNKCISITKNNPYRALAYSNLASCYLDKENFDEAKNCFEKAYNIEKESNNFDGIYYNAAHLAKIYIKINNDKALEYLIEAKRSAEFINEDFYILKASIALGDYYYNNPKTYKKSLIEYFNARKIANNSIASFDMSKFQNRIEDMKLRMNPSDFEEIEKKYGK